MDPHTQHDVNDDDFPAPPVRHLPRWTGWPILAYVTIVVVFAILAVFVVHYVMNYSPHH
jgi:hypothetical protein